MYIIVDDRNIVTGGYATGFDREGVTTTGIDPVEFGEWLQKASESDVEAVEAPAHCGHVESQPRRRSRERSLARVRPERDL